METETRASGSERKDLKVLIVMAILVVPYLAWYAWMRIWPDIEAAVVRVPMRVWNDVPLITDATGTELGAGGEVSPRIGVELLPGSAVALLRVGEISEVAAFAAAASVIALLGVRILRRGLFDRKLPTVVRVSLMCCFLFWAAAGFLRSLGAQQSISALGLEAAYRSGTGEFPIAVFLVFISLVAWFEVILKAGRRIAEDQDGVI
jgi:hypothetical protein